jgi:hypothetical protein
VRAGPRRPIVHGRPALLVAGRLLVHGGPALLIGGSVLAWVLVPALGASGGQAAPFLGTLETYGSETWSLGNVLQREFMTAGHGFVRYALPNGVYYAAAPLHPFMLTPLLGVLCLPGLVVLVRARATAALALLLGWAWAMYAFHAGSTWQNLRYALAYLPPLAIVAAVGADTLLARPGWMRRAVGVWLVGGAVWAIAGGFVLTNQFIERKAADLATVRWVESQTPANAQVLTFGPTLTFRHYGQRETLELFELSPAELPAALATGRPTYLLLDVANVEEQWAGRAPADDYHWLRDGPGLTPLGERQTLTLYRVGGT